MDNRYVGPNKCTCPRFFGQCKGCQLYICGDCYYDPEKKSFCKCYASTHGLNGVKRKMFRKRLLRKVTPDDIHVDATRIR